MKKNKIQKLLFVFLIGIVLGTTIKVSAQTAPDFKNYVETFPETVVRKTTGTASFLHQSTTPVVRNWYSDDGYQLYCADRNIETVGDDTLTKDTRMDYGIAYLLMNAYPNRNLTSSVFAYLYTDSTGANSDPGSQYLAEVFATQYALWGYQGTVNSNNLSTNHLGYTYDNNTEYEMYYNSKSDANILTEKNLWQKANIDNLISQAKAANNDDPAKANLTISGGDDWTKTDDGYKSNLISVAPSSNNASYSQYSLALYDAPEGVKVYTEAGKLVNQASDGVGCATDGNGSSCPDWVSEVIPSGTKVYVYVPMEQAKKGPKFTLTAETTITYNSAYKYVDKVNNHQPSVLVGPESKHIGASLSLTVIPDTASSISSSIYFVGFIILLCGAGIIYANVKQKKQTNE